MAEDIYEDLIRIRRLLFYPFLSNFLVYVVILISLFKNAMPGTAVYSVAVIAASYIPEGILFFRCHAFTVNIHGVPSRCTFTSRFNCTVRVFWTGRIVWALHDFAYFVYYALYAYNLTCTFFFLLAFGIGIVNIRLFGLYLASAEIVIRIHDNYREQINFVRQLKV